MSQLSIDTRVSIHYRVDGASAPHWLLFNGATLPLAFWEPVAIALPGTVVRMDQRNAGATIADGGFSLMDIANDAARLLDHLGIEQVIVAGHAWGGRVAQAFVRDHPHRVRALVICGTGGQLPATVPEDATQERIAAQRAGDRARWERALEATFCAEGFRTRDPGAFGAISELLWPVPGAPRTALGGWDARIAPSPSYWGTARVPTLLVYGTEDRNGTPENARDLASRIPGARLRFIDHAGHFVVREQPAAVIAEMTAFAESLPVLSPVPSA